jgi:hypothetical protein
LRIKKLHFIFEALFSQLIKSTSNTRKIEVLQELQGQIGEYRNQKELAKVVSKNLLEEREKWQSALVEAKKTPELIMVEDAEIQLRE